MHGGTQALQRAERVPVRSGDRTALVPRPNLLGAIIIKAAASGNDPRPRRHLLDLALLCSLVEDPLALREDLTSKDRTRLRLAHKLDDRTHEAWLLVDASGTVYAAYQLLHQSG